MRGKQVVNGDTLAIRNGEGVREVCCSCGLTHFNIYRIVGKRIEVTVYRDDSFTRKVRRERRKR